jgi:hypothetical protein
MPDVGVDLGADLYRLWLAGRDNLPSVADEYAAANQHLDGTNDGLNSAFLQPEEFGLGDYGLVYGPWKVLRDELQTIMADMSVSLTRVAAALCLAATQYAEHDDVARAEFARLRNVNGDPPVLTVPGPRYP